MARKDLIDRLHERAEGKISRPRLAEIVDDIFEHVSESLAREGRYTQPGFGTFVVQVRPARPGRNPRTGEAISLPESSTVRFKPAQQLRDRVNES